MPRAALGPVVGAELGLGGVVADAEGSTVDRSEGDLRRGVPVGDGASMRF